LSPETPLLRIGELARRAGIAPATLRAWERRYGIVEPTRTEAGYRLYSEDDERRLRRMIELITRGAAPAEAAARVSAEADENGAGGEGGALDSAALRDELFTALHGYDGPAAHRAIDRAIAAYSVEALLAEIVLPVLRRIGDTWSRAETSVAQEHFASSLIRGRLMALSRGWGAGAGPLALLACPAGEEHDLGLVAFGLVLSERGWRVALLGSDTPLEELSQTAERLRPTVLVLALTTPAAAERIEAQTLRGLSAPLLVAGAAADEALGARLGARLLPPDIVLAADSLAATV
jgi:DNA-binding transcriptional MerR regulator